LAVQEQIGAGAARPFGRGDKEDRAGKTGAHYESQIGAAERNAGGVIVYAGLRVNKQYRAEGARNGAANARVKPVAAPPLPLPNDPPVLPVGYKVAR
jgi:hypothetical protein